jgi:hypothetical protein
MIAQGRYLAAATAFCILLLPRAAPAQSDLWRMNAALEGKRAPALCSDRDSAALIAGIQTHALKARAVNDIARATRLLQSADQVQSEICRRPGDDDLVILRCKVSQFEAGGGRVSLVKVSALLRAEASKGEQAFFAATMTPLDESGADMPDAQEARRKWCGADAAAGDEAMALTPDIVLQAQQRLYDFGLRMPEMSGRVDADTIQALTEFQKTANLPPTGQLTRQTMDRLIAQPAPSPWVAFAFDGYGNYGASTGSTRRGAERDAVRRLQRRSRSDYKLSSVATPNCIGFATTRYVERGRRSRTRFTQAFTSAGDSVRTAAKNSFEYCEREKGGGECDVRYVLCANGEDGSTDPDQAERRERGRDREPVARGNRDGATRFDPSRPPSDNPAPQSNPANKPDSASPSGSDPGKAPQQ